MCTATTPGAIKTTAAGAPGAGGLGGQGGVGGGGGRGGARQAGIAISESYAKTITASVEWLQATAEIWIDLGEVQDLGIVWRALLALTQALR